MLLTLRIRFKALPYTGPDSPVVYVWMVVEGTNTIIDDKSTHIL
jgi:hypothetical protein